MIDCYVESNDDAGIYMDTVATDVRLDQSLRRAIDACVEDVFVEFVAQNRIKSYTIESYTN